MNIFSALRVYASPYYPIFNYKGREIWNAIFESWGATAAPDYYMFSDRLKTIAAIAKAKALRYRFEKREGEVLSFENLLLELCPHNQELAKETTQILNKAIQIDKSIQDLRQRTNFDGRVNVSDESLDEIVTGPIYYGASYDEFISSAIDFQSADLNEIFTNEVLLDFEDPIYFDDNSTSKVIIDESLVYLNQMCIFKSKSFDLLKHPKGGYSLCIDVNKRFHNGDYISTGSAWMFGQERNNLSVVIIK